MNIVYLLTNTSKDKGTRYYIGSKTECAIIKLDGISTIVSLNDNKPYYSSSSNIEFLNDFNRGDVFEATLLEEVTTRSKLLIKENEWILKKDAVKSLDFYNLSEARVAGYMYNQSAPKNIYGETIKTYGQNESNSSKRRTRAAKLGFKTYGHLAIHIHEQSLKGITFSDISRSLGEGSHFAKQFISKWDMPLTIELLNSIDIDVKTVELRDFLARGCSLKRAAELTNITEPLAEILNDGFTTSDKKFSVARQRGLTESELESIVATDIIDLGLGFKECSKKQNLAILNVHRYFLRYVRKRLKSNDL